MSHYKRFIKLTNFASNKLNLNLKSTLFGIGTGYAVGCMIVHKKHDDVNREINKKIFGSYIIGSTIISPIAMKFTRCPRERGFLLGFGLIPQIFLSMFLCNEYIINKMKK